MGDIADMMLEGTLCEGCGVALDGSAPGYPRRCKACRKEKPNGFTSPEPMPPAHRPPSVSEQRKHPGRNERARAKAAKGDPLPKWALDAIAAGDPIVVRYHCAHCPNRHFHFQDAVVDHLRDVHGVVTGSTS